MATIRTLKSTRQGTPDRYQVVIRLKGHPPAHKVFDTKTAAKRWATKTEAAMREGRFTDTRCAESFTIREGLGWYVARVLPSKTPSAQIREKSRATILMDAFGHLTVAMLTPDHIRNFVAERQTTCKNSTIRRDLAILSRALDALEALEGIVLPKGNAVKSAIRTLSFTRSLAISDARNRRLAHGEEVSLLEALRFSQAAEAAVILLLETGCRRQELCSAKREHIQGSVLTIPEHKTKHHTGKAREVPLSSRAREVIRSLPLRIGGSLLGLRPDSLTQAFDRACKRADIEDLRLHDLRHEALSRLFEAGWQVHEVAAVSGHADWRSLKRYVTLKPVDLAKKLA